MRGAVQGCVSAPLATYETPLWFSVQRGAKLSKQTDGIFVSVHDAGMTRSIVLRADSFERAADVVAQIHQVPSADWTARVAETTRFGTFVGISIEQVGHLIFLRFQMKTGDASGHNMATKTAQYVGSWIQAQWPQVQFQSVSGNMCCDKKVSAVNGLMGRGRRVDAEIVVPRSFCEQTLQSSPEEIAELVYHKNWIGSSLAGSLRSANAHFANMLLAFFVATGQDAANIVEGSQGFVCARVHHDALQFSVHLPNMILGTVGHGKHHEFIQERLDQMQCCGKPVGQNAERLAAIAGAVVLCGELSLLAALTQPDAFVRSHLRLERMTSW